MKHLIFILIIVLCPAKMNAQEKLDFLVITIQKKSNGSIHRTELDYWIIANWDEKGDLAKNVLPLYLVGFSDIDVLECCNDKNIMLFNYSKDEAFTNIDRGSNKLKAIIKSNRKKIQSTKKKWTNGKREKIRVYLTPVRGKICECKITDSKDKTNSKIEYNGNVVIPISDFMFDANFWNFDIQKKIKEFDYTELPFLQFHLIQ